MNSLRQIQACLCAALDPFGDEGNLEAAEALVQSHGALGNSERIRIYQRNVSGAHVGALELVFPVCREILGERTFASLAREYAWRQPTADPDLNRYGSDFAEFLGRALDTSVDLPYLLDLASLEYAWHGTLFEEDDLAFDFSAFAEAAKRPECLMFSVSHSFRLLYSDWPVYELWRRHRDGQAPRQILSSGTADRLVIARVGLEAQINPIGEDAYALLNTIIHGQSLMQLTGNPGLKQAIEELPTFIARGWICGFRVMDAPAEQTRV